MSQNKSILEAVRTLRAGDIITGFACGACAASEVLVLRRHKDDTFDFSVRAETVTITLDKDGPFRWIADMKTFIGKDHHPYTHINNKSRVIVGGGMTELGWYESLPKSEDAPFRIKPDNLLGHGVNPATMAKAEALLDTPDDVTQGVQNLQLAIQTALGGITLSEEQMRCMIIVMNMHTGRQLRAQEMKSKMPMMLTPESIFGAMLAGSFGDMGDAFSGQRGARRREPAHTG